MFTFEIVRPKKHRSADAVQRDLGSQLKTCLGVLFGSFFVLTNHHCQRSPLGSILSLHLFFKFPSQRTIVVFYFSFSLAFYTTFMFDQLLTSVLYALGRTDLIAL